MGSLAKLDLVLGPEEAASLPPPRKSLYNSVIAHFALGMMSGALSPIGAGVYTSVMFVTEAIDNPKNIGAAAHGAARRFVWAMKFFFGTCDEGSIPDMLLDHPRAYRTGAVTASALLIGSGLFAGYRFSDHPAAPVASHAVRAPAPAQSQPMPR